MLHFLPSNPAWFLLVVLSIVRSFCSLGSVHAEKPVALFVFGDSYADTGNRDRHDPRLDQPWRPPYGYTWPGSAAGRFSDGKVLTDFVASFLKVDSPLPYREKGFRPERIARGINFAYGGSGVFETFGPEYPAIDTQISQLHELIVTGLFRKEFLGKSVALIIYGGNDYTAYVNRHNGSEEGIKSFIPEVVKQIAAAMRKLRELGFGRFTLTNLEPTGCLPKITFSNKFSSCSDGVNALALFHNQLLYREISYFRQLEGPPIIILLDQYSSFISALKIFSVGQGMRSYLQPCCLGEGNSSCGSVDHTGKPLYVVCSAPSKAFFWDNVHPTQAGWRAVSEFYKLSLTNLQKGLGEVILAEESLLVPEFLKGQLYRFEWWHRLIGEWLRLHLP